MASKQHALRVSNKPVRPRYYRTKGSVWQRIKPILVLVVGAWILTLAVLRIVAPPLTSLVAIRQIQSIWSEYPGFESWEWVALRNLPMHVKQVVVTAEDARFMDHYGVDLLAVGDVLDSAGSKRRLRGASTITMQTVKNIFLWPGRSYVRKGLEWLMAPVAGLIWGKKRTLELYLNVIEWGPGIYGIDSAARFYFKKPAAYLTLHEAASLAAILPNPRKLSPLRMVYSTRSRYQRIMREYSATRVP